MQVRGVALRLCRVWLAACLALWGGSCAGKAPIKPRTVPREAAARRESLDALARTLYAALGAGTPESTLVARRELDELLTPEGRLRAEVWRDQSGFESIRQAWAESHRTAEYSGFCAQGARDEAPGGGVGLVEPGWTFNRLLLMGHDGTRRSAAWVEGVFVLTDDGFRVLGFSRIEAPRAHHADLDLAPCDVEQGIR